MITLKVTDKNGGNTMKKTITVNNTELTLIPTELSRDIYLVKKDIAIIGWVGDAWEMFIHEFIEELPVSPYDDYVFKSIRGFEVYQETLYETLDVSLSITEKMNKPHAGGGGEVLE